MKIDSKTVDHVAKLANLPLSETEQAKFAEQLSGILDYVDQLNQVETENITPTFNVSTNRHNLADDTPEPSLSQSEAILNAVSERDGYFVTKGVFEDE